MSIQSSDVGVILYPGMLAKSVQPDKRPCQALLLPLPFLLKLHRSVSPHRCAFLLHRWTGHKARRLEPRGTRSASVPFSLPSAPSSSGPSRTESFTRKQPFNGESR